MTRRTKPRTEVKTVYVGLRMDIPLRAKLEEIARREDLTFTQVLRKAVREYLEKAA